MDDRQRGFTLARLVVPLLVIAALLAVGAAYWLRSNVSANEKAARESLHTYNLVLWEYFTIYETYPKQLANLGAGSSVGVTSADLIDPVSASGRKNGYVFTYVPGELDFDGTTSAFSMTATPSAAGVTGRLRFTMDETGVVRVLTSATAATNFAKP